MSKEHTELCKKASNFLRGNNWKKKDLNGDKYQDMSYGVVIVECVSFAGEIPDLIGFNSCCSALIECKVNRADFLSDKKKIFRAKPQKGMGNYRYYYCPEGLIKPEELPDKWGLIYLVGRSHKLIKTAVYQESNISNERILLYSELKRIKDFK